MSCVCHAFASVHCCLVVTWRERAGLLAFVCEVYYDFVTSHLVSWDRCGTWLYRFLILAVFLNLVDSSVAYRRTIRWLRGSMELIASYVQKVNHWESLKPSCYCLFVVFCCFTSQVNSYGHGGTVSTPNHTISWVSLNKQLTSTSCTYFRL